METRSSSRAHRTELALRDDGRRTALVARAEPTTCWTPWTPWAAAGDGIVWTDDGPEPIATLAGGDELEKVKAELARLKAEHDELQQRTNDVVVDLFNADEQANQARTERDQARTERDRARTERDRARTERDQARAQWRYCRRLLHRDVCFACRPPTPDA